MGSPVPAAMAQPDGDPGPASTAGPCFFCGRPCSEDDFCFGCKNLVCPACNLRPSMSEVFGPHRPGTHGSLRRREVMREVDRGRACILLGRLEDVVGVLNSIEALLRS